MSTPTKHSLSTEIILYFYLQPVRLPTWILDTRVCPAAFLLQLQLQRSQSRQFFLATSASSLHVGKTSGIDHRGLRAQFLGATSATVANLNDHLVFAASYTPHICTSYGKRMAQDKALTDNMSTSVPMTSELEHFLKPLHIDVTKAHVLAHELYLAIDIGGTNLRVGFIELLGSESARTSDGVTTNGDRSDDRTASNVRRVLEKSWPIQETLKIGTPDLLFAWIGSCIAQVVSDGVEAFNLERDSELPMGVAFSFPVVQHTLSDATIMAMGKGFAIDSKLDLGALLVNGYEQSKSPDLPRIKVTAILNDAVATLVSFIYQFQEDHSHKAAMGIICGTGTNATIPIRQSILNPAKLPGTITGRAEDQAEDVKVAVNTEWSINGSVQPLRKLGLISKWDIQLDAEVEAPGFQPFEYMTSGRYLGELARLMFLDYMKSHFGLLEKNLPTQLLHRFGLTTTFLSHYQPPHPPTLLRKLEVEFPPNTSELPFEWTEEIAVTLYHIAKSIEVRAAALVASAIVGLLACADDIPLSNTLGDKTNQNLTNGNADKMNLVVGYTGGCIVHFQNYLSDCQSFLDSIIDAEFGNHAPVRLTLSPCHDGAIIGAGVLCGASQTKPKDVTPREREINAMTHHEHQAGDTHNCDDQPDEHTALLQAGQQARYETVTSSADRLDDEVEDGTEQDPLLAPEDSTTPAPGPLKPAEPEDIPREEEDAEANNSVSHGNNANGANNNGDDSDDAPPSFLVNTHPARFRVVFGGIMLTYFIANFDGTIMASSHP
ncbi:hypothetical protein CHU98_g6615, partial [Xylaria longipes]